MIKPGQPKQFDGTLVRLMCTDKLMHPVDQDDLDGNGMMIWQPSPDKIFHNTTNGSMPQHHSMIGLLKCKTLMIACKVNVMFMFTSP